MTTNDEELEEERRLFYVGMTRAERRLFLTSAARRRVFGEYQSTEPSRFVDEVPAEVRGEHDLLERRYISGCSAFNDDGPFGVFPVKRRLCHQQLNGTFAHHR